jgi:hypothetical protein
MSGNIANFISPYSLGNLLAPVDGTTHAAKFNVTLAGGTATIQISSLQQIMGNFQPQSYWIDNSQNEYDLTISEVVYGWETTIPAGQQVWANFPSVQNAIFNLTSTGSITSTVSFFDFPALPQNITDISNASSSAVTIEGQPIQVDIVSGNVSGALTLTDSSVTSTGASQTLVSSNPARKYLMIGAPQTAPVWVNFAGGTASANGSGCMQIQAGGFFESGLVVPGNAVTVFCADTGLTIPCITG